MSLPKRPRQHILETESQNNLAQNLPDEWVLQNVENDYGVDNFVEIAHNYELDGTFFSIQLKGTDADFQNNDFVSVRMRTSTLRYLKERVELVMIVLYVAIEKESYWIWLRDAIRGTNLENKTFTIRIPKGNTLSNANWERIREFSIEIKNRKIQSANNLNFDYS